MSWIAAPSAGHGPGGNVDARVKRLLYQAEIVDCLLEFAQAPGVYVHAETAWFAGISHVEEPPADESQRAAELAQPTLAVRLL